MQKHSGLDWFKVSDFAIAQIPRIGTTAFSVLMVLSKHADRHRRCWPGIERVGRLCGLRRRAVQLAIRVLRDANLIRVEARYSGQGQRSNRYVIAADVLPSKKIKPAIKPPIRWTEYLLDEQESPLHFPGVYVIYGDGAIVYIGSSGDVASRLKSYGFRFDGTCTTPWGDFSRLAAKVGYSRRHADWLARELRLIRRIQPTGNTLGKGTSYAAIT